MTVRLKRIIIMSAVITCLLLIPFIAAQFTDQVNWQPFDFIVMGGALLGVGLAYEFIARRSDKIVYRIAFAIGMAGAFLLFWMNGAVGIIGNENQDINMLYGIVLLVGFIGAMGSRFKARGMALTLFVAATVQFLIPLVGLLIWPPPETSWSPGVVRVLILNSIFVMIFFLSGILFHKAREV